MLVDGACFNDYDSNRTSSIGSDDAVLFVNPTKYSLDKNDEIAWQEATGI